MTDRRQQLGRGGEAEAERVLEASGLRVVTRRHRERQGEIDLVALDGAVVVFVEVKTRRGADGGRPAEAVTPAKQRRIGRVALAFLARQGWLERDSRFDVVEILDDGGGQPEVHHIVDAFRPGSSC